MSTDKATDTLHDQREVPEEEEQEKSTVIQSKWAPKISHQFDKGDEVSVASTGGPKRKMVVEVAELQLKGSTWEYQLKTSDGKPYAGGKWYRETELDWA